MDHLTTPRALTVLTSPPQHPHIWLTIWRYAGLSLQFGQHVTVDDHEQGRFSIRTISPETPDAHTHFTVKHINLRNGHLHLTQTINEKVRKHTGVFITGSTNTFTYESFDNQPAHIGTHGTQAWYHRGERHRDHDLPACTSADGSQYWYRHDKRHRDHDLPAITHADGSQHWYRHGKSHRDHDLPAYISASGAQHWFHRGECHRDHDLPAIIHADGTQSWYQHGELHRDHDRPAVIHAFIHADGHQEWYHHGTRIR